ncbi:MAG: FAD-dependent oxidoreductase [Planctomycetes bacterium]|nr:FAD-dependent oxidoreductase [Planctomycetota bacterium]
MKVDVLVCGGGCAGLGAALAAAREGAKVLLLERAPFAGGILTAVGLPFLDGIACWHTGRLVVRGLALETLVRLGQVAPDARQIEEIKTPTGRALLRHGSVCLYNIDQFKILADGMLAEAGVKTLFHAFACETEVANRRIAAVRFASKDGLTRVEAHTVIDATGDADIAAWSGCTLERSTERMPMTMHFRIGNVRFKPETHGLAREALERAHAAGALPYFYGPGISSVFASDEGYVHAVRVPGNAIDAADLTRAEMQGRRDAWTMFETWKKEVPGFEESYFIGSGPFIGVRETRRIAGAYVLTGNDLLERRPFEDAIATGSWYMDIHPNKATAGSAHPKEEKQTPPQPYDIPYRSLVARGVSNLLVAGRCHSATREAASSTRVTVTAMALGEAAGVAAAMAARDAKGAAEIDGRRVRARLRELGGGPFTNEH